MDELEFRRRLLSDPKQRDKDIQQAIASSDSNAKYAEELLNLDAKLAEAMRVDVPDSLADRILFSHNAVNDNVARPRFVRRAMAMAASVAFVVGLLAGQLNWGNILVPPAQASLAEMAVDHVRHEEGFVATIDEQVSSHQINAKMRPFNFQLDNNFPYHVYYLNHCGFGDSNALHVVFQGEQGKVTLFLTRQSAESTTGFTQDGMTGVIEPVGKMSLILVANEGENVDKIAHKLMPMIKSSK